MKNAKASAPVKGSLVKETSVVESCKYHLLINFKGGISYSLACRQVVSRQHILKYIIHCSIVSEWSVLNLLFCQL